MTSVPALRVNRCNRATVRPDGQFVLYWMIAARRTRFNFGLQHAIELGRELGKPVLVFEALRVGHPWASERFHAFVLAGMSDNAAACDRAGVGYFGYVEPEEGHGHGLLAALARDAAAVVTDEFPSFFLPRMVASAAKKLDVALWAVDSNGLLPLRASGRAFTTAASFRRHLHKTLSPHLLDVPLAEPLSRPHPPKVVVDPAILARWASVEPETRRDLARLPIDHQVGPSRVMGGSQAAEQAMTAFLDHRLSRYADERSDPDANAQSGLSPYLHWGHVSAHEVVGRVFDRFGFDPFRAVPAATGSREGWWGLAPEAESFLDELITWRELGYAFSFHRPDDHDRYSSLPDWAQATLAEHAADPRPHLYDLPALEAGRTHDRLWNAAQNQLRHEGRIHNYLRMLWGKKILEWSPTPQIALSTMIELNNKYALDGRNPNSYSGIFWVLGRFDRPWGPIRPVFGTIRYMTSDSAARKLRLKDYLRTWAS